MFTNLIKTAIRYFFRQKAYSIINIVGLAVGIAATLLILSYIGFELSYDNFQRQSGSLYRVSIRTVKEGATISDGPQFTPPMAPAMAAEFPEVENYVRISDFGESTCSVGERITRIPHVMYADSTFFALFSFQLIEGDANKALTDPFSIVLTEQTALGLFGGADPVGQLVKLDNKDTYRVTGVVKTAPANSHIQFSALCSFSTLYKNPALYLDWNGGWRYTAYVKLRPNVRYQEVEAKLPAFMWRHINKESAAAGLLNQAYLQQFGKIHLYYEPDSSTLRSTLSVFGIVALFILVIACVNFVNLTTARAARRAKEIGIRKVLGAGRSALVRQFLAETVLLAFLASLLGIALVELFFPVFRDMVGKDLSSWSALSPVNMFGLLAILVLVGLGAGSYPALYLSSLQPVTTLKPGSLGRRSVLRSTLIVLQFSISIALIVCTLIVGSQLQFMRNKDLGFQKENILRIPLIGDDAQAKSALLKQELKGLAGVAQVTASSEVPYNDFTSNGYFPEGEKSVMLIHVVDADEDFLPTFRIPVLEGRNFSDQFPTDKDGFLINQSLARVLGWTNPIGKRIMRDGAHPVIGVVQDFNYARLNSPVEPLIITHHPWGDKYDDLAVKLRAGNPAVTLTAIRNIWATVVPSTPFQYSFLDEDFDRLYGSEERFGEMFTSFSILAIVIALMGLLSLSSLSTEQRTKEIGIRKILGASVASVTGLLSGDFLKWVLLANVVAWPVSYYLMHAWLQEYAYRVGISWWPFFGAAAASLALGWLVVSVQTIRAATANPVDALRYE